VTEWPPYFYFRYETGRITLLVCVTTVLCGAQGDIPVDNGERSERDGIRRVSEAGHATGTATRHQVWHRDLPHPLHETLQVPSCLRLRRPTQVVKGQIIREQFPRSILATTMLATSPFSWSVCRVVLQIPRVRHTRLVADMLATSS